MQNPFARLIHSARGGDEAVPSTLSRLTKPIDVEAEAYTVRLELSVDTRSSRSHQPPKVRGKEHWLLEVVLDLATSGQS